MRPRAGLGVPGGRNQRTLENTGWKQLVSEAGAAQEKLSSAGNLFAKRWMLMFPLIYWGLREPFEVAQMAQSCGEYLRISQHELVREGRVPSEQRSDHPGSAAGGVVHRSGEGG